MEAHRGVGAVVAIRAYRHPTAAHLQLRRSSQFDIVQPSQCACGAVDEGQLDLLLLCGRGGDHAQCTRAGHRIKIRIGIDRDGSRTAVEDATESGIDLRIAGHIDIHAARLFRDCIWRRERERALLVRIELLSVEFASASGNTAAVDEVQRVFFM